MNDKVSAEKHIDLQCASLFAGNKDGVPASSSIVVNDYLIETQVGENGGKIIVTRGSRKQELDILNGANIVDVKSENKRLNGDGDAICGLTFTLSDGNQKEVEILIPKGPNGGLKNLVDCNQGGVRSKDAVAESDKYNLGISAFAEGFNSKAPGNFSHASGWQTEANKDYHFVVGSLNDPSNSKLNKELFVVGNGYVDQNFSQVKQNAFVVNEDGDGWFAGKAYVGGKHKSDPDAKEVATQEYVDQKVSELDIPSIDGLASESYVDDKISEIQVQEMPSLEGYATEKYVDEKISKLKIDGASSWNDLTDKPINIAKTVILPEITVVPNMDDGSMTLAEPFLEKLEAGKTYTVNWNGTTYKCVALEVDVDGTSLCLGNVGALGAPGIDDTGEPFAFIALPDAIVSDIGIYGAVYAVDGSTDAVISIEHVIEKINPELLPDNIGGGASSWNDLEDRPFGDLVLTEGSVFPETTSFIDDAEGAVVIREPFAKTITAGNNYLVNWNGIKYECVAGDVDMGGFIVQYIGNIGAMDMGDDTGEPFAIIAIPDSLVEMTGGMFGAAYAFDGSAGVTFSIGDLDEKKLDNKYLDMVWIPTAKAEVETEWIPEMTANDNGDIIISSNSIDPALFMQGKKMAIYIDGIRYESSISRVENFALAGNMSIIQPDSPDNGQPFVIMASEEMTQVSIHPAAEKTFSVNVFVYGDNKLPMQFLPNSLLTEQNLNDKIKKCGFATEEYVEEKTSGLTSEAYVSEKIADLAPKAYVDNKTADLASKSYVNTEVSKIENISIKTNTVDVGCRLNGIAFGKDKFVALTEDALAIYSNDGKDWIEIQTKFDRVLNDVVYGNEMFVAMSSDGTVYNSNDGINWVKSANLVSDQKWSSLVYGNGRFIALSTDTAMAYSDNGITWTDCSSVLQDFNLSGLKFANDKFFARGIGYLGQKWSLDGLTWNQVNYPSSTMTHFTIEAIAYADGLYVAGCFYVVADKNYYKFFYSNDGINWTETNCSYKKLYSDFTICYENGRFVTIVNDGSDMDTIYISENGVDWKICNVPKFGMGAYRLSAGNGRFVCYNRGSSNKIACSDDGISWTYISLIGFDVTNTLSELLAANGLASKSFVIEQIPEPYNLPTASADVKGGVKVGKGLQMDGDVLSVKGSGKYELLSQITVGEGGAKKITFPDIPNVKAVMACILAPTTEKAIGTYMEITADNGETFAVGGDYGDKDGTHSIRIEVYINNGILAGTTQGRTAGWGGGAVKGVNNAGKARFADYIKSAFIYCPNTDRSILEGTVIELYGVRA